MSVQPQAIRKFWRNAQGRAEEVKAQNSSWEGALCALEVVRVTQSFCPWRPEDSSSLALQSSAPLPGPPGERVKRVLIPDLSHQTG